MKKWLSILCCVLLLSACASVPPVQQRVRRLAAEGKFGDASKVFNDLEFGIYGKNNRFLEALDRGLIAHYNGDYQQSINFFEEAKRIYDELYTQSISKIAASWLWNDATLPYAGEDFERAAINIFQALNFMVLEKYDEALVEARNVNSFLLQVNAKYDADKKNTYADDAFVRLLMGLVYESFGKDQDINNAFISYKKAMQIYENQYSTTYYLKPPELLKEKLFVTARWMGGDDFQRYRSLLNDDQVANLVRNNNLAEVYVIIYRGQIVNKIPSTIVLPGMDGLLTRISFPRYRNSFKSLKIPVLIAKSDHEDVNGQVFKVQDWDQIAKHNLENRRLRIMAKAVARPVVKQLMVEAMEDQVRDEAGDTAGTLANLAGNFYLLYSEQADLRAWDTLPADVFLGRLLLTPATYHFELDGAEIAHFSVMKGEKKFVVRWIGY